MSIASKQRTSTVKVGVLTLVSISLLVLVLIWLRGRGLAGGTHYEVLFKDANGLREGAAVQMMGIRVGFIDAIEPLIKDRRYYVRIGFTLNKEMDVRIPNGSRLSIEQSGLIGEQFLEITPPHLKEVTLSTFKSPAKPIKPGIPVKFLYEQGYLQVGKVEKVEQYKDGNLLRHRLYYRITRPGAEMPEDPLFELTLDPQGEYYLRILSRQPLVAQMPDSNLKFTIENPMRLKRFLEIQMDSAEALKLTNDKLNQLLSDETIESLQTTAKNTEVLTARANEMLESANLLFKSTREDLNRLVSVSEQLMVDVSSVSKNVNQVVGDPKLKRDIDETVISLKQSSASMQSLLEDPALKETLYLTRDTSRSASELVTTLRQTAQDRDLQNRMDHIVTQLDTSLVKLNEVLLNVDQLTDDKDKTMEGILEDTRETAKNLRQLSDKLNGRFALFRLLF